MAGLQASLGTHRGYLNKLILIVPAVPTEILGHIYPVKTNIYKYYSISQSFTTFLDLPPRCTIKYFADLLNIFFYFFFLLFFVLCFVFPIIQLEYPGVKLKKN